MKGILIFLLLIPIVSGFDFGEINSNYFNETYLICDYDIQVSNHLDDTGLTIILDINLTGYHEFYAEIRGDEHYLSKERDLIVTGNQIDFLFTESELLEKGITDGVFNIIMDNCSLGLDYPLSYNFSLVKECYVNLEKDCLNYNLKVDLEGTYSFRGELYDLFENKLDLVDEIFDEKEINICFNSSSLLNKELNGPYILKNIIVNQRGKTYAGRSCTSENIAYYSFAETEVQINSFVNTSGEEEDYSDNDKRHTFRTESSELFVEQENKEPVASKVTGNFYKIIQNVFLDENELNNLILAGFFVIGFFFLTKFLTFNNTDRE